MSDWIVRKGYPLLTIKEYGEQWHVRCWPAEEPEKYPDQVINAQKHFEVIKNTPIGTKMRKTTREEKISKPAVYEVPEKTHRKVTVSEVLEELNFAKLRIQELRDRIDVLEKENVNHSGQNKPNLFKTTAMTGNTQDEMIAKLTKMLDIQQKLHETAIDMLKPAIEAEREACANTAGLALLGADKALSDRVLKAIRARGQA
jgi:hypothetical protein